jgi:hypothetical protein
LLLWLLVLTVVVVVVLVDGVLVETYPPRDQSIRHNDNVRW